MNNEKLPQIDSIQELARFWDSHDLADFEEELEKVGERIFERDTVIPLHLRSREAQAIREIAKEKGHCRGGRDSGMGARENQRRLRE